MCSNNIIKFLGLKDVNIKNVKRLDKSIEISMSLKKPKPGCCPHCGHKVLHYHDSRIQRLRDIPYQNKHIYFLLKRTRYKCPCCNKKSQITPDFIIKGHQLTKRLYFYIFEEFGKMKSTSDISKECGISVTTILRYIDTIKLERLEIPEVLCIDEFKGDSGGEKYQVNLADGRNHKIIDILLSRKQDHLFDYFLKIPKEERKAVEYFVSDMSTVFRSVHSQFFPASIHVIDKYHFIRQVLWTLERVRKREQGKMSYKDRIYFKRSKSLLQKNLNNLTDEEMSKVATMLEHNEAIRHAYYLKETFYKYVLVQDNKEDARIALDTWIKEAETKGDKEWKTCIRAFKNWKEPILNSFEVPWTNGYVEGTHNRIKTLKRISFGMPNFKHFRTKILATIS